MATIKSYTDIKQSCKLAEILPLESADMRYKEYTSSLDYSSKHCDVPSIGFPHSKDVPCWSLAALYGILPEGTRLLKSTNISSIGDTKYHCDCPKLNIDKWFDNPVDACVAMIECLHELDLL